MDKVKEQLAVVLKHGFWIGCVLSALLAVGAWYHATSTLATQAQAQKSKINQKAGEVKKIAGDATPHPNQTSLKGMDELNKVVAQDVKEGWKKVYDLQREVLVWPDEFDPKFHRAVDNLRPIEIVPFPTPPEKEINPDFHRIYRDYILNVVPKLAKTVGTEWKAVRQATSSGASADFSGSSSFSMPSSSMPASSMEMGGKKVEDKSLVHWNLANQQEIQNSHFGFAGRADPPKTLEILYAQEDLWVLHSLTEIIRNTNKGAEFYHESSIKDIDYIRIGKNAGGVSGQITWVTGSAEGNAFSGPMSSASDTGRRKSGDGSNPMMMPMTMSPMSSSNPGAAAAAVDPAQYRYVDGNYKLLEAKKIREVITNSVVNEADAVLAVAKRMPVRMRVVMDQRKLPLLITECANSRLPVEVKQVRINRPPGSTGGGGGGSGYSSSSFMPSTSADSSPFGQFSSPGSGGQRAAVGPDPNNVTVEVFGIIYIYNPPNDAQLGLENLNRTAGITNPPANLASR